MVEEAEVPGESAGSRTSKEEFEDTKGVMIREAYNAMTKWKRIKGQAVIFKTLYSKLKIEQHELH